MMIHGYCELCRRFKRVRLAGWSRTATVPMPFGTCADCLDERDRAILARREAPR